MRCLPRVVTATKMSADLRLTSDQLQILAAQLHRATKDLPSRCRFTALVFDAGKPLDQMTVAELLPLAAKAVD